MSNGIPGLDKPTANAEEEYQRFMRQLCGEILLVAGRCQTLATVITEG